MRMAETARPRMGDVNTHLIFDILLLVGVVLTLFMAWATHRKLKEHSLILGVLVNNALAVDADLSALTDRVDALSPVAPVAPVTPALATSGSYLNASGEMCSQIRGPWGVKEDCRPPSGMTATRAALPTPKELTTKSKY